MARHNLNISNIPEQYQGYMDFFSELHENNEAVILEDSTWRGVSRRLDGRGRQ